MLKTYVMALPLSQDKLVKSQKLKMFSVLYILLILCTYPFTNRRDGEANAMMDKC